VGDLCAVDRSKAKKYVQEDDSGKEEAKKQRSSERLVWDNGYPFIVGVL
jgi:hypothetical protein